jgi:CheY-like chemotaxis protein
MTFRTGARVVLVSDDVDEWNMLRLYLATERQDEVLRCDPLDGDLSACVISHAPDLILLSFVYSPRPLNTFALCRRLRETPVLRKVPILFWRIPNLRIDAVYSEAQRAGAAGGIPHVSDIRELLVARDTILAGGMYFAR